MNLPTDCFLNAKYKAIVDEVSCPEKIPSGLQTNYRTKINQAVTTSD